MSDFQTELLARMQGSYEKLNQPLYDTVPYPESGFVDMFNEPVSPTKTTSKTNMWFSNFLPNGQAFIIERISIALLLAKPSARAEKLFYSHGEMTFIVGAKQYLNLAPIGDTRGDFEAPEFSVSFIIENGAVSISTMKDGNKASFNLSPNNLLLSPMQPFRLKLTHLPALKVHAQIHAKLYGVLLRQAQ
jgi:hypothetical protein